MIQPSIAVRSYKPCEMPHVVDRPHVSGEVLAAALVEASGAMAYSMDAHTHLFLASASCLGAWF